MDDLNVSEESRVALVTKAKNVTDLKRRPLVLPY